MPEVERALLMECEERLRDIDQRFTECDRNRRHWKDVAWKLAALCSGHGLAEEAKAIFGGIDGTSAPDRVTAKQKAARNRKRLLRMMRNFFEVFERSHVAGSQYDDLVRIRQFAEDNGLPVPTHVVFYIALHEAAQRQAYGKTLKEIREDAEQR